MENMPNYPSSSNCPGPSVTEEDLRNSMNAYSSQISSLFSNTSSSSSSPAVIKKSRKSQGSDHEFKEEYEAMFTGIKKSSKGNGWFFCSYCYKDLKFTSRGPYDIKTHIDRPRHIAFVQQSTYSGDIHSASGPICDICNRRYKDHRSLSTHKRIEHNSGKRPSEDSISLESPEPRVLCEVCERTYKDERSLRSHQRIEHGIFIDKPRKSDSKSVDQTIDRVISNVSSRTVRVEQRSSDVQSMNVSMVNYQLYSNEDGFKFG